MNVLYIIGNGFDLNLGMKTSYSDFYKYYTQIPSKSQSISTLKTNIAKGILNWSDLELALGKYTEKLDSVNEFHEVFEDIGDNLADYLNVQEDESDFNNIQLDVFFDDLSNPEKYLLTADRNAVNNHKVRHKSSIWTFNIVTFNYTRTIEKILGFEELDLTIGEHYGLPNIIHSIEHIHGFTENRMVLGVNDTSHISNSDFHNKQDILEAFVKNDCNGICKHTIDQTFSQLITSANIICIFGSSIGDTDRMWWNKVINQLKQDCILIIFIKSDEINPRRMYKIGNVERSVRELLYSHCNLTIEERSVALHPVKRG
jgi:hypothetical protein